MSFRNWRSAAYISQFDSEAHSRGPSPARHLHLGGGRSGGALKRPPASRAHRRRNKPCGIWTCAPRPWSFKVPHNSINRISSKAATFHFSCLSRRATNGLLLNVVRLCLNLAEHMLGGIKAILFLKQCSARLSLSIISSRLRLQNEMSHRSVAAAAAAVFQGGSQIGVTTESHSPSNLLSPDSDCTPSEKTNLGAQSERICGAVFSTLGETAVWRWR